MPVTVDYTQINLAADGADFASKVKTQIQSTQTDLGKMSEKTADETISGIKTHTGVLVRSNAFFCAYNTSASAIADQGSFSTISWTTPVKDDDLYTLVSSQELQVSQAGYYLVSYDVSTDNIQATYSNRYTTKAKVQKKPSAGSYSDVAGTYSFSYNRNSDDGEGTCSCVGMIVSMAANDRLRIQAGVQSAGDAANDIVLVSGGCRFLVQRL